MLQPTKATVQDFSGKNDVQGVFEATIQHKHVSRIVPIYVVCSNNCIPLLSRSDSTAFGILRFNKEVVTNTFEEYDTIECKPVQTSTKLDRQFDDHHTPDEIQRPFANLTDKEIECISQHSISQTTDAENLGNNPVVANMCSRQSSSMINQTDETTLDDVGEIIDRMITSLPASSTCLEEFRQQNDSDPALQQVNTCTNSLLTECLSACVESAKQIYTNWNCFTDTDDILLNLHRIAATVSLQQHSKQIPHCHCDENRPDSQHAPPKPPPLPDRRGRCGILQKKQRLSATHARTEEAYKTPKRLDL